MVIVNMSTGCRMFFRLMDNISLFTLTLYYLFDYMNIVWDSTIRNLRSIFYVLTVLTWCRLETMLELWSLAPWIYLVTGILSSDVSLPIVSLANIYSLTEYHPLYTIQVFQNRCAECWKQNKVSHIFAFFFCVDLLWDFMVSSQPSSTILLSTVYVLL